MDASTCAGDFDGSLIELWFLLEAGETITKALPRGFEISTAHASIAIEIKEWIPSRVRNLKSTPEREVMVEEIEAINDPQ